eukprot:7347781-Lingulodinium_polyedra.AAC.1
MGSDALSANIRSCRALGDRPFHSSCACNARCQSAAAAALPQSITTHQGMSPACCLLRMAWRASRA